MEASEALAGNGGQAAEGAQTGGEQQTPEIPQAVADRFGELDRSFGERFDQLQEALDGRQGGQEAGQQQQQQYEQGGEPELYLDEQTGDIVDRFGRTVDPRELVQQGRNGQVDPQVLGQLQTQMQQQMQQQLAPIMEFFEDQQAADLEDRYPAFRDEKYSEKIVKAAEERAAQFGNPELARNVGFIELLHLAEVGGQRAAGQETPAGASETGVQVETDGVTNAGASEPDPGDRIVAAAGQKNGFFNS